MTRKLLLGLTVWVLMTGVEAATYRQNFDATPSDWLLYNEATVPTGSGYLRLNPNSSTKRGEAWYKTPQATRAFTVDFQFRVTPAPYADGMTFGWVTATNPAFGETGSCLGAYTCHYSDRMVHGYDGYFVEIDTYAFVDESGVPTPHIAVCRSTSDLERDQLTYSHVSLSGNVWYDMRVKLAMTGAKTARVSVWYDAVADGRVDDSGTPILTCDLTNYTMSQGYFGFTGATAAFTEEHDVDNVRFNVTNPPVGPKAPSSVLVRPLQVTADTDLRGWAVYNKPLDRLGLDLRYQWERSRDGGQTWVKYNSKKTLSHKATRPKELWRLAARSWNSIAYSNWVYSRQIRIPAQAETLTLTAAAIPTSAGTAQLALNLSADAVVAVTVSNLAGRVVAVLPTRELASGLTSLTWNGRTSSGTVAPPGQYLIRLQAHTAGGAVATCTVPLRR